MTYQIVMNLIYNLPSPTIVLINILETLGTMMCLVFTLVIPHKAPYKAYKTKKGLLTSPPLLRNGCGWPD